jgi:hypothetical protein
MVMLVANGGIRRERDVVMGFDGDEMREEIATRKCQVLGGKVGGIVCKLDAGDQDIADLHYASSATSHVTNTHTNAPSPPA